MLDFVVALFASCLDRNPHLCRAEERCGVERAEASSGSQRHGVTNDCTLRERGKSIRDESYPEVIVSSSGPEVRMQRRDVQAARKHCASGKTHLNSASYNEASALSRMRSMAICTDFAFQFNLRCIAFYLHCCSERP
jgi:hypothetical protein